MNKFIIISGPTASGKSALALEIAKYLPITIINADALQIYKSLPILSCQPSKIDQNLAAHKLYSLFAATEFFSVAKWLELVKEEVTKAWQENKLPVMVGGSGMYISKLINGINEIPPICDEIRNEARILYDTIFIEEFKKRLFLLEADDSKKEIINSLDKQRLIRNYEVIKQTGKSISWWHNQPPKLLFKDAKFLHFSLDPNRAELYENCNHRFKIILESGAIEEVKELLKLNLDNSLSITKTIGYQEIKDFLLAKINFEEMISLTSQKTRNYAKRQLTWFRNQFLEKIVISNVISQKQQIISLITKL
jgi:tRNA dimethylallyltransferase